MVVPAVVVLTNSDLQIVAGLQAYNHSLNHTKERSGYFFDSYLRICLASGTVIG